MFCRLYYTSKVNILDVSGGVMKCNLKLYNTLSSSNTNGLCSRKKTNIDRAEFLPRNSIYPKKTIKDGYYFFFEELVFPIKMKKQCFLKYF